MMGRHAAGRDGPGRDKGQYCCSRLGPGAGMGEYRRIQAGMAGTQLGGMGCGIRGTTMLWFHHFQDGTGLNIPTTRPLQD